MSAPKWTDADMEDATKEAWEEGAVAGRLEKQPTIDVLRTQLKVVLDSEADTTARYDARIAELEAETARLRATNETLQRKNDIAEARVRAWHGAVYMVDQNPKLRPVQPTPFGDDVPPILALRSEKLITLLDKVNRLREALTFYADGAPCCESDAGDGSLRTTRCASVTCEFPECAKPQFPVWDRGRRAREALKETK